MVAMAPARLGYPEGCRAMARRGFGPCGPRLPVTWRAASMARWPAPTAIEPWLQGGVTRDRAMVTSGAAARPIRAGATAEALLTAPSQHRTWVTAPHRAGATVLAQVAAPWRNPATLTRSRQVGAMPGAKSRATSQDRRTWPSPTQRARPTVTRPSQLTIIRTPLIRCSAITPCFTPGRRRLALTKMPPPKPRVTASDLGQCKWAPHGAALTLTAAGTT